MSSLAPPLIRPAAAPPRLAVPRLPAGLCLAGLAAVPALIAVLARGSSTPIVAAGNSRFSALPRLGAGLGLGGFLALLGVAGVLYALVLLPGATLSARAVWAAVLVAHVALFLGPILLSQDVFSYVSYGRLGALHGIDPYRSGPIAAPHDAAFAYVGWKRTPSVYGPVFTLLSYAFAPLGVTGAVWAQKALAAASSLGVVALAGAGSRRLGRPPARAVAAIGLNPIWLVWGVGGAHNDLLMLLALTAGALWVLRGDHGRVGAAVIAAAAVKASAGIALPFVLLAGRFRAARGALVAAAVIGAGAWLAFGSHALDFVAGLDRQQGASSAGAFPAQAVHVLGGTGTPGLRLALHGVLALLLLYVLVRAARARDPLGGAGWALLLTPVLSWWFLPWYTLWALPFALLGRDRRLLPAILVVQALVLVHLLAQVLS